MKNSLILFVVLLFLHFSSNGQYQKAASIGANSYYVANAAGEDYLVTTYKSKDSIEIRQPDVLNNSLYAFSVELPNGYAIDSVYSFGFALLKNLDVGVAFIAKNNKGEYKGFICNTDGEIKWEKDHLMSFRTFQVGNKYKILYSIINNDTSTTFIMDINHTIEAVYPTALLGANTVRLITDTNDFRFYYINTDSNKLYSYNHRHKLIEEIPITVPTGYTLQPEVELFINGEITALGTTNYAVYFQKSGTTIQYLASIINQNKVVQSFANCSKLDLQIRNNGSVLNAKIHASGKTTWHVYTLSPSSGNTNTATYAFNLYSRLIYENRYSQSGFGIPTDSFNVDFYDVYLNKKIELQVKLGLKKTDELIAWKAFHDGGSDGLSKNQEVYYIWKDGQTGDYIFRVVNNKQEVLLERKNARWFEFYEGTSLKKTQFILHIPSTGSEVYEYDFSLNNLVRTSPLNKAIDVDFKTLRLTWEKLNTAESYTLTLRKDTVNYDGYITFQQITDTFYTLENYLDSGTTYYWLLSARNARTYFSQKHYFSFSTIDPSKVSKPTLVAPSNGAKDVSYVKSNLYWNSIANATSYTYQISSTSSFANYIAGDISDTMAEVNNLSKNNEYFWRVRASNSTATGDWSEVWNFTTALSDNIEEHLSNQWRIYPNPASSQVQLTTYNSNNLIYNIYNVNGQQVWSGILQAESTTQIDVSNWKAGIYQVVLTQNGERLQKRLVIY